MTGFSYKSYNFIGKDPLIDEIRTVYQDSGVNYKWIEDESGVTSQTLKNWFGGVTRRPQAATANAVLRCLGFKLGVVPYGNPVKLVVPMTQAEPKKPASVRHVVQMSKYKKGGKR
jgi:hypothetical protein